MRVGNQFVLLSAACTAALDFVAYMVSEYPHTALQVIDRYATGEVRPHLVKLAVRVLQLQQPMVAKQLQAHGWSTAIFKVLVSACTFITVSLILSITPVTVLPSVVASAACTCRTVSLILSITPVTVLPSVVASTACTCRTLSLLPPIIPAVTITSCLSLASETAL